MKHLFLPLIFLFLVSGLRAQVPGIFAFQGVAKSANGQPLAAGTSIKLRFTVHEGNSGGSVVLIDTHSPTVSQGGIFNVFVGNGNLVGTSIYALDWGNKNYYLQIELAADDVNYVDVGTTQFVSVPYALYTSTAKEARSWQHSVPVVQTGVLGQGENIGSVGSGARLIWYPKKGAFRAGDNFNGQSWQEANIGDYSFAGNRGRASGMYSTAFGWSTASGESSFGIGHNSTASGTHSIAGGLLAVAFGNSSIALGRNTEANGDESVALGTGTVAKAFGSTTIGAYNNIQDNAVGTVQGASGSDRIFQIGNGMNSQALSNAVTVLRNGNVGIGNNAINPQNILEIGGRARLRHNGTTAGIYCDDSQNNPVGFVGMMNDYTMGFYIGGNWMLQVDLSFSGVYIEGNLGVAGEIHEYSDRRLKKDFSKLHNSFTKLNSLQGYNYFWKDSTKGQSLQTGLIAQEVEEIFPELVKTDEKGMKSVNYIGLVPHLIESVKEQSSEISALKEDLQEMKTAMDSLRKSLAALQKSGTSNRHVAADEAAGK